MRKSYYFQGQHF